MQSFDVKKGNREKKSLRLLEMNRQIEKNVAIGHIGIINQHKTWSASAESVVSNRPMNVLYVLCLLDQLFNIINKFTVDFISFAQRINFTSFCLSSILPLLPFPLRWCNVFWLLSLMKYSELESSTCSTNSRVKTQIHLKSFAKNFSNIENILNVLELQRYDFQMLSQICVNSWIISIGYMWPLGQFCAEYFFRIYFIQSK